MAARPRFDPDAPYIVHPRSAALYYAPFPAETLHALADIRTLQRHTQDAALLDWLEEREAMLIGQCATCPPVNVRNVEPLPPRQPRKAKWFNSRGKRS